MTRILALLSTAAALRAFAILFPAENASAGVPLFAAVSARRRSISHSDLLFGQCTRLLQSAFELHEE